MKVKKDKILHRLLIAKGHLEKVVSMYESGAYCIDTVHQSMAVQSALKKVDQLVLENHLKSCVVDSIKKGDSQKVVKEMVSVFEKK